MKFKTALRYQFVTYMKSLAIFMGAFLLIAAFLPLFISIAFNIKGKMNSDLLVSSAIFMVISTLITSREDFNLFIQNGVSRKNILFATIINNISISMLVSLCLILLQSLIAHFSNTVRLTLLFIDSYADNHLLIKLGLTFISLFFVSSLGILNGFFYQRVTKQTFIIVLSAFLFISVGGILGLQLLDNASKMKVFQFICDILGITPSGFKPMPFVITFSLLTTINFFISFLLNRHREIKRINA